MQDFYFLHNQKTIQGSDFIKNTRMSLQSTADSIQMYHFPTSSMSTELLISILQTHLNTLAIFESYLKLQKDVEYEESISKNTMLNTFRPEIQLCNSN
jgi:hypothetical protein